MVSFHPEEDFREKKVIKVSYDREILADKEAITACKDPLQVKEENGESHLPLKDNILCIPLKKLARQKSFRVNKKSLDQKIIPQKVWERKAKLIQKNKQIKVTINMTLLAN